MRHLYLLFLFPFILNAQVEIKPDSSNFKSKVTIDNVFENNGMKYPSADGSNGQVLTTDGMGNLTWQSGANDFNSFFAIVCNSPMTYNLGATPIINDECGTLYDSGGAGGNYSNNENNGVIISFAGNPNYVYTRIILKTLEIEDNRDTLFIEGMSYFLDLSTPDTLYFDGSTAVTIDFKSDNVNTEAGFELMWDRLEYQSGNSVSNMLGFFFNAEQQSVGGGVELDNAWTEVGEKSVLLGFGGEASNTQTTSVGYKNEASGSNSSVYGYENTASGSNSQASGYQSQASGQNSQAMGYLNKATGQNSLAFGQNNSADTTGTTAIGFSNVANSFVSGAIGHDNDALNERSNAFGTFNDATGLRSSAFGYANDATEDNASAFGYVNEASARSSSAFGALNDATGMRSLAVGYLNDANAENSAAVGYENDATGISSSTFGYQNTATGSESSAFGFNNTVGDSRSVALGSSNSSTANNSLAIGNNNTASNIFASAIGYVNLANEASSSAYGYSNAATSTNTSAFGFDNTASGPNSTAIGYLNSATASLSSAVGYLNNALKVGSSAFGYNSNVDASRASAFGTNLIADVYQMTAVGCNNEDPTGSDDTWVSTQPVFVIGNGENSVNRSTALTILKNGNVGIGEINPQELLHIDGTIQIGSNEKIQDGGSNEISTNSTIIPFVDDNGTNLGRSNRRWSEVWAADGTINTSDRKHKANIKKLNYGLEEILQLEPVRFRWKDKKERGEKLGLIAQDLLEVLPEVVKTHEWVLTSEEEGASLEKVEVENLGVFYSDIIPVLIHGIQEQQEQIERLEEEVEALKTMNERILALEQQLSNRKTVLLEGSTNIDRAQLHQNQPNPFKETTTIEYYLPENLSNAIILLSDINGNVLKRIQLNHTGKGSITLETRNLPIGTYQYALVTDGKVLVAKQMVFVE